MRKFRKIELAVCCALNYASQFHWLDYIAPRTSVDLFESFLKGFVHHGFISAIGLSILDLRHPKSHDQFAPKFPG
jgi:hypothetical protein